MKDAESTEGTVSKTAWKLAEQLRQTKRQSPQDVLPQIEQAEQLFSALQLKGVPSRFVRYPRTTSHGMSRGGPTDMRIHRLEQIIQWWKEWF